MKKWIKILLIVMLPLLVMAYSFLLFSKLNLESSGVKIIVRAKVDQQQTLQLYFAENESFLPENLIDKNVSASEHFQNVEFALPQISHLKKLRFDPLGKPGSILVKSITFKKGNRTFTLKANELIRQQQAIHDISDISLKNNSIKITSTGIDPYLFFTFNSDSIYQFINHEKFSFTPPNATVTITFKAKSNTSQKLSLFYTENGNEFLEKNMIQKTINASEKFQNITFLLPPLDSLTNLRFDPGEGLSDLILEKITFSSWGSTRTLQKQQLLRSLTPINDIDAINIKNKQIKIITNGQDPYLYFTTRANNMFQESRTIEIKATPLFYSFLLSLLVLFWLIHYTPKAQQSNNKINLFQLKGENLFIIVFLLVLILPGSELLLNFDTKITVGHENRTKAKLPEYDYQNIFKLPKKYNEYLNDNFGYRDRLLEWNSYIKVKGLRSSPVPDKVLLGKNNWLYFSPNFDPKYHPSTYKYTNDELEKIKFNLEERYRYLENNGAKFYVFIIPIKHSIYPEHLPDNIPRQKHTKLDQLIEYFEENSFINIIDVRSELIEAKDEHQLYYKNDMHWNMKGGVVGYAKLIDRISKDFPSIKPIPKESFEYQPYYSQTGDLSKQIMMSDYWTREAYLFRCNHNFLSKDAAIYPYIGNSLNKDAVMARKIKGSDNPKLLMYRDSYTNYIYGFMCEHFSKSTFLWSYSMNPAAIKKEQPDVVVLGMLEIFLDDLLISNPNEITHK